MSITNIPVAATVDFDKTKKLTCTESSDIKMPPEDVGGHKILCSEKNLRNIRNNLLKIRKKSTKSTGFWVDLFSALAGAIFSLLATAWILIPIDSFKGILIYLVGVPSFIISFFIWLWLKYRPGIDITERVDAILEDFPDIDNARIVRKKS